MKLRVIATILYSTITLIALLAGLFLYWEFQSTDILKINGPITVVPPIAANNTPVVLNISYCKNSNAGGKVRTSFVNDSVEIFQPMSTDTQGVGCHIDAKVPILLPPSSVVPPGKYRIKFHIVYQVNPIKTADTTFYTQWFEIR